MSPEAQLLLACARVNLDVPHIERIRALAAGGEPPYRSPYKGELGTRGGVDWARVMELATRHGLRPLLYRSLSAACPDLVSPGTLQGLRAHYRANTLHNLRLARELLRVLAVLDGAGIAAVPLKGPVLAETVWGDIGLRESCDLDVLVHREDALRARGVLVGAGYRCEPQVPRAQERQFLWSQHEFDFSREDGPAIDLQWRLAPRRFPLNSCLEGLWARCTLAHVAENDVPALSAEDSLLFLCVHGTRHQWADLVWLCDIAELIKSHPALEWESIMQLAQSIGAGRMMRLALLLCQVVLGADLPGEVQSWVEADLQAWHQSRQLAARLLDGRPLLGGAFGRYLFYLRASDHWRCRVRSVVYLLATPSGSEWAAGRLRSRAAWANLVLRPTQALSGDA